MRKTLFSSCPALFPLAALWFACSAFSEVALPIPDPASAQPTTLGRYRISYAAALDPITINRIHAWVVRITDAGGAPVANADIQISGGMPAHDHGLPTAPQATAYLGDGRYLIEGMRFHMGGAWELVLTVRAAQGTDSLSLSLDL